jgi:hypothetical protein
MRFQIEQIALCPPSPEKAMELLTAMGAGEWARDHVCARGAVFGHEGDNEADLAFEYSMLGEARELEVLSYTQGPNWMDLRSNSDPHRVSHLGMHCSEEELACWRRFFAARGIAVAQEVLTTSHTNPVIAGERWYCYVIFDTHAILGVDIKLIVRRNAAPDF